MTVMKFAICTVLIFLKISNCAPPTSLVLSYLQQYGYLEPEGNSTSSGSTGSRAYILRRAIEDFQSFAGLEVTGELDNQTFQIMQLPRCGMKDNVLGTNGNNRLRRYVLEGTRWEKKHLKYQISKYPKNLAQSDVDKVIHKAFSLWMHYTPLTFTPSSGSVDINIRFDGHDGTLGRGSNPSMGGDVHFDADQNWAINSTEGTDLLQVAAHMFGHTLGLEHSNVWDAVMSPFYRGYNPNLDLHEDDIQGIQTMYGRKKSGPILYDYCNENLCTNPKIDTIFHSAQGNTYVFKGDKYWKLINYKVAPGYPKLIYNGWPGLPGNIDAAFTYTNGKTYFFKGCNYWRYKGRKMDGNYPKKISDGFPGIPDDIDTAMVWRGNGKMYFFKGDKFWKFDHTQRPMVSFDYPRIISVYWRGIPSDLDAAFNSRNGYTYFFKDKIYYRFNDKTIAVDVNNPVYPRPTASWWFGCKTTATCDCSEWCDTEEDFSEI